MIINNVIDYNGAQLDIKTVTFIEIFQFHSINQSTSDTQRTVIDSILLYNVPKISPPPRLTPSTVGEPHCSTVSIIIQLNVHVLC
jgi:hypothetical protein